MAAVLRQNGEDSPAQEEAEDDVEETETETETAGGSMGTNSNNKNKDSKGYKAPSTILVHKTSSKIANRLNRIMQVKTQSMVLGAHNRTRKRTTSDDADMSSESAAAANGLVGSSDPGKYIIHIYL